MFPCFFSLNQSVSHSWTYSSSPSLFQKLQSRHQHISFPHFFCIAEKYNLFCLLHLFICLYVSFLSVSTFFFIYLSLRSFLSVSTFFLICLYLLFYLSLPSFYLSLPSFLYVLPSFLSVSTFFFVCLYLIIFLFFNYDLLVFSNYYGLQMDLW